MASASHDDHLVWTQTTVRGRAAMYGVAGRGLPVLFLHGWGLGQHTYKRSLKRLAHPGCQGSAPATPGVGGAAHPPGRDCPPASAVGCWLPPCPGSAAPPTCRGGTAPSPATPPGPPTS